MTEAFWIFLLMLACVFGGVAAGWQLCKAIRPPKVVEKFVAQPRVHGRYVKTGMAGPTEKCHLDPVVPAQVTRFDSEWQDLGIGFPRPGSHYRDSKGSVRCVAYGQIASSIR